MTERAEDIQDEASAFARDPGDPLGSPSGITRRALITGALLSLVIAVGVPYGGMIIQGSRLGLSSSTPAAFFLLFVWLIVPQTLLGLVHRRWAFSREELITLFIMMAVATAIPTRGFTGMLLPMITGAFYYATPENNWAQEIQPYLPDWIVLKDPQVIKDFYEGFTHKAGVPWAVWAGPLFWWLVFIGAFYLVVICIMVLLRRQWVEHERLVFPVAQVPLAMIQDEDKPSVLKPLFKNPLMWVGFALPFIVNSVNALHHYYHFIPTFGSGTVISLFRRTISLRIRLNWLMFGFAYFINSTISFSLWFFYLLRLVQEGTFSILGIGNPEELGPWTDSGEVRSILGHQMMGSIIVLVLFGMWMGRRHLVHVFRSAFRNDSSVVDSDEILSYRAAVLGISGGLTTMGLWLWRAGIPAWVIPLLFFGAFTIFIGLARTVAEAGMATVTPAMVPAGFIVSGVGSSALGQTGMITLGFSFVWAGDLLVFMMAPVANAMRMSGEIRGRRRRLFWGMIAAIAISLVASLGCTLILAYKYGALNLHRQYFGTFAQYPFSFAVSKITSPTGPNVVGWLWTAFGGLIMALLMIAQHRFLWWPLHPLGFVVGAGWTMNNIWLSVFLAWLIKVIVLKYGGPKLYRSTRPFFLGVILGQFVVAGFWLIVDAFTGMVGNTIPVY